MKDIFGFFGILAPVAFVFAISALSQVNKMKEEINTLKAEVEKIKGA